MSIDVGANITWTKKLENYFASTGERAHCLSWAHQRAEALYSLRRTFIDLPVIVLSSVTGFLSVGSTSMFEGKEQQATTFLGAVSLFVGVLNTLGSYFSWAKKSEAHRIAAIHYAKLYRFISVEMALPRDERTSPHEFLKYCKEQYERLAEISPPLPDIIVNEFKAKFAKNELKDISVPEQMNGLEAIYVYNESDLAKDLEVTTKTKKIEAVFREKIETVERGNARDIDSAAGVGDVAVTVARSVVGPASVRASAVEVPQLAQNPLPASVHE